MDAHAVAGWIGALIGSALVVLRAAEKWFEWQRGRRAESVKCENCPWDLEVKTLLMSIAGGVEKIAAVLVELRADHRVQDVKLDTLHEDIRIRRKTLG